MIHRGRRFILDRTENGDGYTLSKSFFAAKRNNNILQKFFFIVLSTFSCKILTAELFFYKLLFSFYVERISTLYTLEEIIFDSKANESNLFVTKEMKTSQKRILEVAPICQKLPKSSLLSICLKMLFL